MITKEDEGKVGIYFTDTLCYMFEIGYVDERFVFAVSGSTIVREIVMGEWELVRDHAKHPYAFAQGNCILATEKQSERHRRRPTV